MLLVQPRQSSCKIDIAPHHGEIQPHAGADIAIGRPAVVPGAAEGSISTAGMMLAGKASLTARTWATTLRSSSIALTAAPSSG